MLSVALYYYVECPYGKRCYDECRGASTNDLTLKISHFDTKTRVSYKQTFRRASNCFFSGCHVFKTRRQLNHAGNGRERRQREGLRRKFQGI